MGSPLGLVEQAGLEPNISMATVPILVTHSVTVSVSLRHRGQCFKTYLSLEK